MIKILTTTFLLLMLSNTDRYVEINDFEKDLVAFTDSIRMNSDNLIEFIDKERWINTSTYMDEILNIKYLNGQKEILKTQNCFEYYLSDISSKKYENRGGSLIRLIYSITLDSYKTRPKVKESPLDRQTTREEYNISYYFFLKNDIVYFEGIMVPYHFPIKAYRQCEEQ
jgi:hypothetical protein